MSSAAHNLEPRTIQASLEVVQRPKVPLYKTRLMKFAAGITALAAAGGAGAVVAGRHNPTEALRSPGAPVIIGKTPGIGPNSSPITAGGNVVPSGYTVGKIGLDYPRNRNGANAYITVEGDTTAPVLQTETNEPQVLLDQTLTNRENLFNSDSRQQAQIYLDYYVWGNGNYSDALLNEADQYGKTFHIDLAGQVIPEESNMNGDAQKTITFLWQAYSNGKLYQEEKRQFVYLPRNDNGTTEWVVSQDNVLETYLSINTGA